MNRDTAMDSRLEDNTATDPQVGALEVEGASVEAKSDWGRRRFLGATVASVALALSPLTRGSASLAASITSGTADAYSLPKLAYAYDALAPYIDAKTMEIHHSKHHQAYITNANKALADHPELAALSPEKLVQSLADVPEAIRMTLRNNAGGHVNHTLFWEIMAPGKGGVPSGELLEAITGTFGSFDNMKTAFTQAAMTRFGSGWAWLVKSEKGLAITSTANQDSPLMEGQTPLLGVDVWEHAYYLNYQNRRADYIQAWWNVVNWDAVTTRFRG